MQERNISIFDREAVEDGMIELQYCPTNEMNADLLTKPLPKGQFEKLQLALGMDVLPSLQSAN